MPEQHPTQTSDRVAEVGEFVPLSLGHPFNITRNVRVGTIVDLGFGDTKKFDLEIHPRGLCARGHKNQ